jgi:hypothetical protein
MITPQMAQRLVLTDQDLENDRMIKLHVIAGDDTPSYAIGLIPSRSVPRYPDTRMPMC